MPVFHVYLNGKKLSTAGTGNLGVLGARRKGQNKREGKPESVEEELRLQVGGLVSPVEEHVSWLNRGLKIGDEVRIVVGEDGKIDRPRLRQRRDRTKDLRSQKRYVRKMARSLDGRYRLNDDLAIRKSELIAAAFRIFLL